MPQTAQNTTIDTLLTGLKEAAGALNDSIMEMRLPKRPLPPRTPRSRHEVVQILMEEVERRYGIAPGEQVERKLLRVFEAMSFELLAAWSSELLAPGAAEAEWLSLVESLTVHETYFCRDRDQLGLLQSEILPGLIEARQRSGAHRLRIWSAGCASGEEPYNLAMLALLALKEAGCAVERGDGSIVPSPRWSVSVLGSDVSAQMIRIAKGATYTAADMGAFRDMDPHLWHFFEEADRQEGGRERTFRVRSCVSDITRFRRHNLLEPLVEAEPFDLIMCRNVLIYFDSNKKPVQDLLCGSLAGGGALMLGATDALLCSGGVERRQRNGIFWYRKT